MLSLLVHVDILIWWRKLKDFSRRCSPLLSGANQEAPKLNSHQSVPREHAWGAALKLVNFNPNKPSLLRLLVLDTLIIVCFPFFPTKTWWPFKLVESLVTCCTRHWGIACCPDVSKYFIKASFVGRWCCVVMGIARAGKALGSGHKGRPGAAARGMAKLQRQPHKNGVTVMFDEAARRFVHHSSVNVRWYHCSYPSHPSVRPSQNHVFHPWNDPLAPSQLSTMKAIHPTAQYRKVSKPEGRVRRDD